MSASLVGSEMCIRDRSTKPSALDARRPPPQGACWWRNHCGADNQLFKCCLLYTSDAADDM
eukprot:2117919-Alexandrium_andersonii.AAC.1